MRVDRHLNRVLARFGVLLLVLTGLISAFAASPESAASIVVSTKNPLGIFQWKPFLGPFHSIVLHYPIGFLSLAVILEIYRQFRPTADFKEVIRIIVWLSLISGLLAALLGIIRAAGGGYEQRAVDLHRVLGMAVPVVTIVTLYLQRHAFRDGARRGILLVYRAALIGNFILLGIAGHYGGNLTHGSRYLVENAPEFLRSWLEDSEPTPESRRADNGQPTPGEQMYFDTIRPIFRSKCISCHGAEKQKGDYRLDQAEVALTAGSSGRVAIKPGDPFASELVRLVLLPRNHDDVMPPDGKEPLTDQELIAVIRWIQIGAPFPTTNAPVTAIEGTNTSTTLGTNSNYRSKP